MLPLGVFLAFMKAPTSFWPVGEGLWMVVISCMILVMSGVSAAVVWGEFFIILYILLLFLSIIEFTFVLLSGPSFRTGILASRTGLYSPGMMIGVPEKIVGGGGR